MNISSAAQERRSLDFSRLMPLTLAVLLFYKVGNQANLSVDSYIGFKDFLT